MEKPNKLERFEEKKLTYYVDYFNSYRNKI